MAAKQADQATLSGTIGGDGASLRRYASSNQDMISLSYEPTGRGLSDGCEIFNGLGICWMDDLKAHLQATEKENHLG